MNGKPENEKSKLRADAERMLHEWYGIYHTHAVFEILDANSDGDDLILGDVRIPMLRQQKVIADGLPNLCLADFVRPVSTCIKDKAGAFATTVDSELQKKYINDDYKRMMSQVLADRLAEGTAERMHEEVRRKYWGYAPNEKLSMEQTHNEEYQGIRPAVGYPSLPDTSINFIISNIIDMKGIGIRLTESGMMTPHASVSGFMFSHPKSKYFDLGRIGNDQIIDYANRRGIPVELVKKFLKVV
jgi:cobalamin-dependent methionine synthase I